VETEHGAARVSTFLPDGAARAAIALGHGAGRGTDTPDLQAIAAALPAADVAVVLIDQPWVVAGRRIAAPAARLDAAWTQVVAWLLADGVTDGIPLVVGGRSTGARVACRTAAATGAAALLLLSFPLTPPGVRKDPGRAARSREVRLQEWSRVGDRPVVLVQGDRDAFGSGPDVLAALAAAGSPAPELVSVPGADHSLRSRAADAAAAQVVAAAGRAVELACRRR
jgi:uncharacterized protein